MFADITFAGSGIAATVTLLELFDQLLKHPGDKTLKIAVIEKKQELWVGVPYGIRSSVNALTITHVYDFLNEPERPLFLKWLLDNKDKWTAWYLQNGGATAQRWLSKNLAQVEREQWESVYIPRFLFGWYLTEKLQTMLAEVERRNLVEMNIMHAEVTDIEATERGSYFVIMEHPDKSVSKIETRKLVVAVGSAPVKKLVDDHNINILYINDIYEPSESENTKALADILSTTEDPENRNVLLIGSNASAIEYLYLLEGMSEVRNLIHKLIVISPSGLLPYPISTTELPQHDMPSLDQLEAEGSYNLESLIEATTADLRFAVQDGAQVGYIATIIGRTNRLLEILGEEAKRAFIGIYGPRLSQKFRRSGPEYKSGSDLLIGNEQVVLLRGRYIKTTSCDTGASLTYINTDTGKQETYPLAFRAVINCSGSDNLARSSSRLINNLVNKHNCRVNLSGKGFEVNEQFEVAPNLYIMGPLLGGTMNKLIHFWHLENAPRLMYLAPYLAETLLAD